LRELHPPIASCAILAGAPTLVAIAGQVTYRLGWGMLGLAAAHPAWRAISSSRHDEVFPQRGQGNPGEQR